MRKVRAKRKRVGQPGPRLREKATGLIVEAAEYMSLRELVAVLLEESTEPASLRELCDFVPGVKRQSMLSALKRMMADGLVIRVPMDNDGKGSPQVWGWMRARQ